MKSENEDESNFKITYLLYADEQYVEISFTSFLALNNKLDETFLIMCVNARSLVNSLYFSKFKGLISGFSFKTDLILITETWIQPFSLSQYKNQNGFKFVTECRKSCIVQVATNVKYCIVLNTSDELTIMQGRILEPRFINIRLKFHNT